jgi:hypothetical protein
MRFDVTPTVEHDPRSGERASWEGIPLVGISAG